RPKCQQQVTGPDRAKFKKFPSRQQADAFVRKYGSGSVPGLLPTAEDEDGFVYFYTDGSWEGNGTAAACAGLGVYFGEGNTLNASVDERPTIAESLAAAAIRLAKQQGIKRLTVNTDSKFLIDSVTKWLPGWKRNAWKLSTGKPVKNHVDFEELDRELADKSIKIKWNHVDVDCGILGN
ncbi:hypothetical protein pipiens_000116, partial [Culex pipiens pipiens]